MTKGDSRNGSTFAHHLQVIKDGAYSAQDRQGRVPALLRPQRPTSCDYGAERRKESNVGVSETAGNETAGNNEKVAITFPGTQPS